MRFLQKKKQKELRAQAERGQTQQLCDTPKLHGLRKDDRNASTSGVNSNK